ncbi:hypothetical protein HanIR_Chr17g0895951 [Helianthus annuus]|nr:hypothetical protein HanIR_Chr17g0895951 [Helianthus annuus]
MVLDTLKPLPNAIPTTSGVQMSLFQLLTQIAPDHDFISLAADDDVILETQPQTTKTKKGKTSSKR